MEHLFTYWGHWQAVVAAVGTPQVYDGPWLIVAILFISGGIQAITLGSGVLLFFLQFEAFFGTANKEANMDDARSFNIISTLILGTLFGGYAVGGFLLTFTLATIAGVLAAACSFGWFLYKLWWPLLPTPGNRARWVVNALSAKRPQ